MGTEPTTLAQPHDCGRSIAGIVREIDELKDTVGRVKALADRMEQIANATMLVHDGELLTCMVADIRSALAGGAR